MITNRIQHISRFPAPRAQTPAFTAPAGFMMVPAQAFQAMGMPIGAAQLNIYAAAYEQARQSVQAARQRRFSQSQFVALN